MLMEPHNRFNQSTFFSRLRRKKKELKNSKMRLLVLNVKESILQDFKIEITDTLFL